MNKYTKALSFDEDKHQYSVNGNVIPSVTEICGPLTYSKYRVDNAIIEQAAFRGSMIHELTSLFDRGDLDGDSIVTADVGMYVMAWIAFCRDYTPRWEYIELPLACRTFAGTVDRVGVIDGKRVVVDIKTTSSMDRANKIAIVTQIHGYNKLCNENGIETSFNDSLGVQLKKDGTYSVIQMEKVWQKYMFHPEKLFYSLQDINCITKGERSVE